MVAAADAVFLDAPVFERRTPVGAVEIETADRAAAVPEYDQILAHDAHPFGQFAQLRRGADGLPVAAQHLAHGRSRLDAGEFVVLFRQLAAME